LVLYQRLGSSFGLYPTAHTTRQQVARRIKEVVKPLAGGGGSIRRDQHSLAADPTPASLGGRVRGRGAGRACLESLTLRQWVHWSVALWRRTGSMRPICKWPTPCLLSG